MIVVTAPTSTIGRDLLPRLLDAATPLRLIVRDPARLDPAVAARAEAAGNVEVVVGSHGDPEVIDRACEGARAVFWLAPADGAAPSAQAAFVDFTRPAAQAFVRHGVPRVVGISALGRGTVAGKDAGLVTASLAMDDLIAGTGVAYRAVVCPSFMHNLLRHVRSLREGWFSGMGRADLPVPLAATADIGAAAARLLLDDSWAGAGFAETAVLGPQDLSPNQMAEVLGEVLGREVSYRQVQAEAFAERLVSFGTSAAMAAATVEMFHAKNQGMDNAAVRTVATGMSFRTWCEQVLAPAVQG